MATSLPWSPAARQVEQDVWMSEWVLCPWALLGRPEPGPASADSCWRNRGVQCPLIQRLNAQVPSLCSGRRVGSGLRSRGAGWGFPLDGERAKACWGRSLMGPPPQLCLAPLPQHQHAMRPGKAVRCASGCSSVSACVCVLGEGLLLSQTLSGLSLGAD